MNKITKLDQMDLRTAAEGAADMVKNGYTMDKAVEITVARWKVGKQQMAEFTRLVKAARSTFKDR